MSAGKPGRSTAEIDMLAVSGIRRSRSSMVSLLDRRPGGWRPLNDFDPSRRDSSKRRNRRDLLGLMGKPPAFEGRGCTARIVARQLIACAAFATHDSEFMAATAATSSNFSCYSGFRAVDTLALAGGPLVRRTFYATAIASGLAIGPLSERPMDRVLSAILVTGPAHHGPARQ